MNGSELFLRVTKSKSNAKATTSSSFASNVASNIAALLLAVKNTCASVRDALVDLLQRLKATTNKAKKAKPTTSCAWTIPVHDASVTTSTKRVALPRRRHRSSSTASTSSSTSTRVPSTSATTSSSSTIAAVRERSRARGRFIQARRRHIQATAASAARDSITTDVLMDYMHSILTPASTSVPTTTTAPILTRNTTPRMLRFHGRFARSPYMAPTEPPVFDDLLLPSSTNGPMTPATRGRALRHFAMSPGLQMQWAALRIQDAAERRQQTPAPQDPMTYECGCGWCPRGVAAYELCAAVTIRRTMRSFRMPSVASKLSRHQHFSTQATTPVGGRVRA